MKKKIMDYIREESDCNYYDILDYFSDLNQCGHELKAKYLGNFVMFLMMKEYEESKEANETKLFHAELGSLKQISDSLYREMKEEVERNGYSDLTLNLEGATNGINSVLEMNNVVEEQVLVNK